MEEALYQQLLSTYTTENLSQISRYVLSLYKNNDTDGLKRLLQVSAPIYSPIANNRQLFSKLMMRYHPDKLAFYFSQLSSLKYQQSSDQWQDLLSIISVLEIIKQVPFNNPTKPDFASEYRWEDPQEHNLYDVDEEEDYGFNDFTSDNEDQSFYAVFKRQQYGERNIEMPSFLLEDIDELEMPSLNIETLDGLHYCAQLIKLDLSSNQICDLDELAELVLLEELYLSDNQISWIDVIGGLSKLRILDLSGNTIDDIGGLENLRHLEYIDLTGNPIPERQINKFKEKDIIVII